MVRPLSALARRKLWVCREGARVPRRLLGLSSGRFSCKQVVKLHARACISGVHDNLG